MHACLQQMGAEILSLLLNSGADPTLEDHGGLSALVYAVNSGNRDILSVLLDACKAKGKEVIIITTNKLPSGHQVTKQYLNVPPSPEVEESLHYLPASCYMSPYEVQLRTPPQGSSAKTSPQPGSPLRALKDPQCLGLGHGLIRFQPGSPMQHRSPLRVPDVDKRPNFHQLHSEAWSKSPSLLLQQSQASSLTEEPVEITPEEVLSFRVEEHPPAISRHQSIDFKDAKGLVKALEILSGNDNRGGGGKKGFGRKMSYDSAASSLYSVSHPNLLQDSLAFSHESRPADEDSSDCLTQMNVSSLQNVVRRRNIGIAHYSSDSQLQQFSSRDRTSKSSGGAGLAAERHKLVTSRASNLSGSRESLESSAQRRATTGLERRGSGALLLDHIAHTRPGYLPRLNPHIPIPDIGVSSNSSCPLSGSTKTLNGVLIGPKPVLPCVPVFPKDLKAKEMLWRRHSMQSDQIKQLANFAETFGH